MVAAVEQEQDVQKRAREEEQRRERREADAQVAETVSDRWPRLRRSVLMSVQNSQAHRFASHLEYGGQECAAGARVEPDQLVDSSARHDKVSLPSARRCTFLTLLCYSRKSTDGLFRRVRFFGKRHRPYSPFAIAQSGFLASDSFMEKLDSRHLDCNVIIRHATAARESSKPAIAIYSAVRLFRGHSWSCAASTALCGSDITSIVTSGGASAEEATSGSPATRMRSLQRFWL